ncbi:hypothetical protein [Salidesulfovibrio brasiliensis]|uniref:hypothetical protein n=1 Tax=Salidesulfovibrio brasiliensis TaxID=221711 RepID=UPI000AE5F4B0|nr:hypothetical protein [Salidesulfovibrio brasiliensis]
MLAENLALRALDPMFSADFLLLKDLVDGVRDVDENVDYAFILDRDGNVLAHTFSRGMPVGLVKANELPPVEESATVLIDTGRSYVYDFAVPVEVAEKRLGTVRVGLSRSKIQGVINELLHPVMGVSLGTLLVAVFLGSLFANKVTSRINELRRHAEALVTGKLSGSSGPKLTRNCWEVRNCTMTACPPTATRSGGAGILPGTSTATRAEPGVRTARFTARTSGTRFRTSRKPSTIWCIRCRFIWASCMRPNGPWPGSNSFSEPCWTPPRTGSRFRIKTDPSLP